ncbi:MAG: ComEC/Rec2 family competence protein [Candidatus Nealsonbacteria bacterium]
MAKSKIFLYFCLSFVLGIAISSFVVISQILMLGILILGIFLASVFWSRKKVVLAGFCLLFLVSGALRHQIVILNIPEITEQNISFTGIIVAEPDVRETNAKLTVKWVENRSRPIVLVTTSRYPEYKYGDKLKITGKLQAPPVFDDFNYGDYLKKDGIYSVLYYPKIELMEEGQGNFIYAKVLQFKNKLRESIYRNLSPPQSSILGAMILGDKSRISDDLKEDLNMAGVRHITAISGMHIMILAGILMSLSHSFYFSLTLLFLFILMIGFPASAVRAGIMGGLFLFSKKLGRQSSAFRLIIFAATFMLCLNPLLLKSDIGFQLSFLAVLGMIYLTPHFQRWLKFRILSMTLSAQVFTLPVLIYNFGCISYAAPLTNILIVPLLPFLMGLGLVFALAGLVFQPLAWIISWPVWLFLTYIIKIVEFFS